MDEEQIKAVCKLSVEYGKRNLTRTEKEFIKTEIDNANTIEDFLKIVLETIYSDNKNNS